MSELKGACIFGQSGGPTSVINASAYGVIATALKNPSITRVLGAEHGIKGVLNDRLFDMGQEDPAELELLKYTPSSALGSCRYKMADPDVDDTDYKRILEIFKKYDVRYFFYNGGNDSMDTCNKISKYMQKVGYECRVMGVPKTITHPARARIFRQYAVCLAQHPDSPHRHIFEIPYRGGYYIQFRHLPIPYYIMIRNDSLRST